MLKAPMPYFGGKISISHIVWERLGDCPNYVEPFFGSGAMLLARPDSHDWASRIETVNDKDGLVANFWRAVQADPEAVARWADSPINENDLHARHAWLVARKDDLAARLEGDPEFYDAKIAGWWVWGMCAWIGSGWCSGEGPWRVVDGRLVNDAPKGEGTWKQRPHLGNAGQGINRQLPHLGNAGQGINRQLPHLGAGRGINRQRPHLGGQWGLGGQGFNRGKPSVTGWGQCADWTEHIITIMAELADRLRRVRVCCGDYKRVLGPTPTFKHGITGIFLDPPYDQEGRSDVYNHEDRVSAAVGAWCKANGDNPLLRIALCGYDGEYDLPGWEVVEWKAKGGYGNQGEGTGRDNANRERIWFSPHCLKPARGGALLELMEAEG